METIILAVTVGLGIAFFATQNTQGITIHLAQYQWKGIPLYSVVVGAILAGLVLAWVFSLVQSFSWFLSSHAKDSKLRDAEQSVAELTRRIHHLELENAKLTSREDGKLLLEDNSLK